MEITAILNTHGKPDVTWDTVDSIRHYMTDQILLVVDEAAWDLFRTEQSPPVSMLKGFHHNFFRAPYRNIILGLMAAGQHWPDSQWYCYLEYDCLIGSSIFKKDLAAADDNNVWCMGNDYRVEQQLKYKMPLVEAIAKTKFTEMVYLLGACIFYNHRFMKKALELDFYNRFLVYTNDFKPGYFPEYTGWDLVEHMMPTLAKAWGGKVQQLAKWASGPGAWVAGNWRRYPIRWQPDLQSPDEYLQASIMHPIKSMNDPIREFHRAKRLRARQTSTLPKE